MKNVTTYLEMSKELQSLERKWSINRATTPGMMMILL
jgi:hypothetical protein